MMINDSNSNDSTSNDTSRIITGEPSASMYAYPNEPFETITLGMGCFWSPEALFGQLPGVQRTRTGFAGGSAPEPTYRQMGDHSEVIEIDFVPERLPLEALLHLFWDSHNPRNINGYKGRQYWSIVLYRDERQRDVIEAVREERLQQQGGIGGESETELASFRAFYPAEEKHQKYYLKRYPDAVKKLLELYPDVEQLADSTLAARLNGVAKGHANRERVLADIGAWPIDSDEKQQMTTLVRQIRW